MNPAAGHLSLEALIDYWVDDDATTDAADAHLIGCDACGAQLDALIALGDGVRTAFRAGAVAAVASDAFLRRLAGRGVRVREYRLPQDGGVDCRVEPGDELLAAHLEVPLADVERLDALVERSFEPGVQHRLQDLPFDAARGEVVLVPRIEELRGRAAHEQRVTLLAVTGETTRELGHYTFRHQGAPAA